MSKPKYLDDVRTQELIDDVKARLATKVDKSSSPYSPGGSIAFASLPAASADTSGMVFNITDDFTTTADFVEGAGIDCNAGTDVAIVKQMNGDVPSYKYNIFSGTAAVNSITSAELATMWKDNGTLTLSANTATLSSVGDTEDITVTAASGTVTAVSSDTEIATVSVDTSGTDPVVTVEAVAAGTCTVTVTAAETAQFKPATADIAVTCSF